MERRVMQRRGNTHYNNCKHLATLVEKELKQGLDLEDWKFVESLEQNDSLFPDIDISVYVKDAWKQK